jgi:pimeloyl-ACP methyl ester carboxylesterase
LSIRGLSYQVREWGPPDAAPLLLLHGARDASVSFQFLVDALGDGWWIVAPDWRGHGQTTWTPGNYWLADFLCDLDALFDELFSARAVPVVGHSMGGNISALYAGVRPQRVSRLVMLDALGTALDVNPVHFVEKLVDLLDSCADQKAPRVYKSVPDMAARLMAANRRLDASRATYLADAIACRLPDGGFRWPHDPAMFRSFPSLHSVEEWTACWQRIEAPVLCLLSSDPRPPAATSDPEAVRARAAQFRNITVQRLPDTGHNLHHDAPVVVAQFIQEFMRANS